MGTLWRLEGGGLRRVGLEEYFDFIRERGHMAALVGAGGKTTLMYALAESSRSSGLRTAVTTTTHILPPEDGALCRSLEECRARWDAGGCAVWGRALPDGKLGALGEDEFALLREADTVLVEADGAKRLPCKAPAAHEPRIPSQADIVIGVLGLSALGKRLDEACFRREEAMALLGRGGEHRLTGGDLAALLLSERGAQKDVNGRKFYAVLNQCDNKERLAEGLKILELLRQGGLARGALACFRLDGGVYGG